MRLKDVSLLNPQYKGKMLDKKVSFVPMESLRNGAIDLQEILFADGKGKYTYFGDGDLLIAKVTPCFENGNIAIADNLQEGVGFGSSEIFVLRMNKKILNSYMFYLSQTSKFQDAACATMCGVGGLKRISPLFMRTYELSVPSISEQQRIVDYLDAKLSEIDKRVSVLEKQLDAYARLKKSIIHQAVTRGLNPDVRLKDSGIEWIGMIPEHWDVKRIKDIGLLKLGKMLNEKAQEGYALKPYLKSKNIGWLGLKLDEVEEMFFNDEEMGMLRLKSGDILFSEGGEVGKCSIWNNELNECYIQNSVHKLTVSSDNDPRYYLYYSYMLGQMGFYKSIVNLVSIMHLTFEKLRRIIVLRPSLSEQRAIAEYLDEKCAKIDAAIENIGKQIDTSKRLKRAIINEAISGKTTI